VDYALVLALVAAFGEFLPILAAVPAVLVALFDSPVQAVIVAVFYLVLQQIESNIIMPNVMSNQADVPPLLTIVAISAGGTIGGILGALIAIPLAGVLKVMVTQVAAPAIRRWTGATQSSTTVTEALEE
jgi:predicted PurR-regulated permease PerM